MSSTIDLAAAVSREIADLPTLPGVVEQILAVTARPEASIRDLERVVAGDMALSARILRAANSGLYALPSRVASINHAVVILGFRVVRSLALSSSIMDSLGRDWRPLDAAALRRHSLATAAAARVLARKERSIDPEIAFTAGLLHDIGKVLIARIAGEQYGAVIGEAEAERSAFGLTHADVGARMLEHWRQIELITDAVRRHHNADAAGLARVIADASAAAGALGFPAHGAAVAGGSPVPPAVAEAVRTALREESGFLA